MSDVELNAAIAVVAALSFCSALDSLGYARTMPKRIVSVALIVLTAAATAYGVVAAGIAA